MYLNICILKIDYRIIIYNLYDYYIYFLCLEDDSGNLFGVFLMNSNIIGKLLI